MENRGKGNFGCGDWTQFLQGVPWGEVGDSVDAFNRGGWSGKKDEELKRANNTLNSL